MLDEKGPPDDGLYSRLMTSLAVSPQSQAKLRTSKFSNLM